MSTHVHLSLTPARHGALGTAVVTGAGGGLGRQHALALGARGAKVLVNDLGGTLDAFSERLVFCADKLQIQTQPYAHSGSAPCVAVSLNSYRGIPRC